MARSRAFQVRIMAPLRPTVLQRKLLVIINNKEAMREAHRILGIRCNEFVPQKNGELRTSMRAYPQSVRWEAPYARYQYEGEVYGPNYVGWIGKGPNDWEWRSPETRYPTGRMMGKSGIARLKPKFGLEFNKNPILVKFGYTTPNTGHHWFDTAMKNGGLRAYSLSVTAMLKQKARKLNR